jgi:hypothetical protein
MLKAKLIKRGIPELGLIITLNDFQAVVMLIVQPPRQALKVLNHSPRVTKVVVNDDKNVSLASHEANPGDR